MITKFLSVLDVGQSRGRSLREHSGMKYDLRRLARLLCLLLAGSSFITLVSCSPSTESNLPEKTFEISGNDQMKFNIESIDVQRGQKVTVIFKNVGTMPKESMGHNWVLLAKNTDPAKFVEAGLTHASNSYIDPAMEKNVLAHTKILGPGESATISFTAPKIPGAYDYVCTFTGHFAGGMRGKMNVQ